jgi:hypothetical protein
MGTPWRRVLLVLLGAAWALPHEHFFHGDAVDPVAFLSSCGADVRQVSGRHPEN